MAKQEEKEEGEEYGMEGANGENLLQEIEH